MLDKELERNFQNVFVTATAARYQWITVEALLLELLENPGVEELLKQCGADKKALRDELREFLDTRVPKLADGSDGDPQPTIGFQRVIERALTHVETSQRADRKLHGEDVLVAIFDEPDSWAVCILANEGVEKLKVTELLCRRDPRAAYANSEELEYLGEVCPQKSTANSPLPRREKSDPLKTYTVNLNEKAKKGELDPLIGRDREIDRMVQILCRRRKNNPLLVGEAGVGKTALAEGLASRIVEGRVPDVLAGKVVRSLSMGYLVAGTKYRGDFEERMKQLIEAVKADKATILFIDEIHGVIGAGSTSNSQSLDAADLLKPALSNGDISCIGATTFEEFRQVFEKDHALSRRFQKVEVLAPSESDSIEILRGLKGRLEKHHEVKYTEEALEAAVRLSARYIPDRELPDKAIDVLDEAGAAQRLVPAGKRAKTVGRREIEKTVASIARVPAESVGSCEREKLKNLDRDLSAAVFGQPGAVEQVACAVRLSRSGLSSAERPVASFLFVGPTGVGKTELARQLAKTLGVSLLRFDMSEYAEAHSVSRLIGAPPGYVGFEQGGLLTEAVNRHPYAVLLLDEMEKAHSEIYNILLQVMDCGTLTDRNGRKADFRNVILIMTSNAGASRLSRNVIGFGESSAAGDDDEVIRRTFSPEFRNRLDAIVRFNALGPEQIARIVDKFLEELAERLSEKGVRAAFSPALRAHLAEKGVDPQMGARPMRRLIQEEVERQLANELLFGALSRGGSVSVGFRNGKVCLSAGRAAGEKPAAKKAREKTLAPA